MNNRAFAQSASTYGEELVSLQSQTIRALIFDLDDTLYCEREFLVGGYRAVAECLSAACSQPCAAIHEMMMEIFAQDGRRRVMPAILGLFPGRGFQVPDLVRIYRRHTPSIGLFTGYAELLKELRSSYRLGIVTDGAPEVQRAKCAALGLEDAVDSIIYTWENGRDKEKPNPFPFCQILRQLQVEASEALFIGDNLEKDIRGARGVGMRCARVQSPPILLGAPDSDDADFIIDSLTQLPLLLRQLEDQNETA
jgi:putative hydrolase of the HAD superfamily